MSRVCKHETATVAPKPMFNKLAIVLSTGTMRTDKSCIVYWSLLLKKIRMLSIREAVRTCKLDTQIIATVTPTPSNPCRSE